MPDLLHLRSEAVRNPELYKPEVMAEREALTARIELFKLEPQFEHEEMVELFQFLEQLSSSYEEINGIPNEAMALLAEFGSAMHEWTRESLLKLAFTDNFVLDKTSMQTLLELVVIKDKPQREAILALVLFEMRRNVNVEELDTLCNALHAQSKTVKQFIIRLFAALYQQKILMASNHYEKIVNAVAYVLVESGDKRIIKMALNFMTNTDENDDLEDDEDEDGPRIVVTDEERELEIAKLMTKLKKRVTKFSLDESRKKKDVDVIRKQITKLHTKMEDENRTQLYIIDYLRDPEAFAEELVKKFLLRDSPFKVKLVIFDYVAQLSERYELIVSQYYSVAAKYLRPREIDVKEIIQAVVQSVHQYTPIDDVILIVKQLVGDFVHSGATDEEVTVAITAITGMAKILPDVLAGDNAHILNELVGYARGGDVGEGAAGRGSKTSSRTRKGVVNASRALLNLYRERGPELLEKRFLNKDAALRLQERKRAAEGVEDENGNVPDLSESIESEKEDEEPEPSKHQKKKREEEIKRIFGVLKHHRTTGKPLNPVEVAEFSATLGYDIDCIGNKMNYKTDSLVRLPQGWPIEMLEETFEFEEEESDELSDSEISLDDEESISYDKNIPIAQQRVFTEEEIDERRAERSDDDDDSQFDIDEFVKKGKMTEEERHIRSKQSKEADGHKSNFWNRKEEGKSKTNKEKQVNKPMLMVLHSQQIRRRQNRSGREKDYVMRTHMRNQKRGITKKVKI